MTDEKKIPVLDSAPNFEGKTIDDIFPSIHDSFLHRRHDEPCPKQIEEDISKDIAINEWVLNHLPLQEHQKAIFLTKLQSDQLKKDKQEKAQRWRTTAVRPKKTEDKSRSKVSVKNATKQSLL